MQFILSQQYYNYSIIIQHATHNPSQAAFMYNMILHHVALLHTLHAQTMYC